MMSQAVTKRKFIVGLGNPGRRYAKTRHNVGWMVLALLRQQWQVRPGRKSFNGMLYDARPVTRDGQSPLVLLFEPLTYMNSSGQAVKGLLSFYQAQTDDLLVVLDDMALPIGKIRARASGSSGGHNGLKDIIALLGSDSVPRLRVGIGPAPEGTGDIDYVLSKFTDQESETIGQAIEIAAKASDDWVNFGIRHVMDRYNKNGSET